MLRQAPFTIYSDATIIVQPLAWLQSQSCESVQKAKHMTKGAALTVVHLAASEGDSSQS